VRIFKVFLQQSMQTSQPRRHTVFCKHVRLPCVINAYLLTYLLTVDRYASTGRRKNGRPYAGDYL